MGVCQTKKQNQKLDSSCRVNTESKTKMDVSGTQENELKKSLFHHQDKRLNTETFCSQNIDCPIPATQRCHAFTMPKILNIAQGFSPLLELTSASKKYTIIGQHKSNYQLQILQNNKTGMLVQMENIPKNTDGNEKYINWLQKITIDHPNILRIIEIYQDKTNYQIISEYFNGASLSDLIIGETKVSKPQVVQIYEQIMSAMSYLHQKNIVHGNLTLKSFEYVNFDDRIVVKLTNLRTIYYKDLNNFEVIKLLPPECLYHQNQFTKERDIWTVGLIGLILRQGKFPYDFSQNSSSQQIMISIIKDHKFNFQHKKDHKFKHFLETVLSKVPQQRLDFETLLKHEFIKCYSYKKANKQELLLNNFLTNKPCCLIQQLILGYFGQEYNLEEYIAVQKLFLEANLNNDGFLSKQELSQLFQNQKINKENIATIIDDIFQQFEISDGQGINQNQFISLTLTRSILLTQENIETCFAIFSFNKQEIQLKGLKRHLQCESVDIKQEFASITDDVNTLNQQQFESLMKLLL